MLHKLFLRLVAPNIAALVAFLKNLEDHLTAFVQKEESKVTGMKLEIAKIEQDISDRLHNVSVAKAIQSALPTAK